MSAATMQTAMPTLAPAARPVLPTKLRASRRSRRAKRRAAKRAQRIRAVDSDPQGTAPTSASGVSGADTTLKANSATDPTKSTPAPPSALKTMGGRIMVSMKFRGGAPELINGRCAMIGFPAVMLSELSTKKQFVQLLADNKLLVGALFGVITVASLIPIARGVKTEKFGLFTREAELLNGRAAMVGFLALLILEAKSGTSFF